MNPDDYQVQEMPLLPISALESLEPGQMYFRISGYPLIETHFERSYLCPEFVKDGSTTPEEMEIDSLPFNSEKYRYKYLFSPMKMADYAKGINNEQADEGPINLVPDFLKTW